MAHAVTSENIIKQGYLKKSVQSSDPAPSTSKLLAKNIRQKLEPTRWYVFVVRNRCPYLEYYEREEQVFSGRPIRSYDLSTFQNLSYTMGRTSTEFIFCLILADRNIELSAASRVQMVEWCRCLERHLRNLGIRQKNQKGDHEYTSFPVRPKPPAPKPPEDTPPDAATNHLVDYDDLSMDGVTDGQMAAENDETLDYVDPETIHPKPVCDLSNMETLPLRPPPVIPPRHSKDSKSPQKHQEEDVFADFASVKRDPTNSQPSFDGHNHKLNDKEKRLFESDLDKSESDDSCEWNEVVKGPQVPKTSKHAVEDPGYAEEDSDRLTSLIENNYIFPVESDTSEDSDFVSASFWLRNRVPEKADSSPPPLPGERLDSLGPMSATVCAPNSRLNPFTERNYLHENGRVSPTLLSLGVAPSPHVMTLIDNEPEPVDQNLYDVPRPYPCPVPTKVLPPAVVNTGLEKFKTIPVSESSLSDNKLPSQGKGKDSGGNEMFVACKKGALIDFSETDQDRPKSDETSVLNRITQLKSEYTNVHADNHSAGDGDPEDESDDVYGASWLCSSAGSELTDVKSGQRDDLAKAPSGARPKQVPVETQKEQYKVPFNHTASAPVFQTEYEPNTKPEQLVVDVGMVDTFISEKMSQVELRSAQEGHNKETNSKQKHKSGILKKLFPRLSREIELPEQLIVDLPSHSQNGSGAAGAKQDGNLYSDMPGQDCSASAACHVEAGHCEISNPEFRKSFNSAEESKPLSLPKRDFGEYNSPIKHNTSVLGALNQNFYEDVQMPEPSEVQSANKNGLKEVSGKFVSQDKEDPPVAPPRRNKMMTLKSPSLDFSKSLGNSSYGTETLGPSKEGKVPPATRPPARPPPVDPVDMRAKLPTPPTCRKAVDDRPAVPPPPRRSIMVQNVSESALNKGVSGARPKSMHIASRQQSVSSSSGSVLTVMNLKQNQVDILRSEIESVSGLCKLISKAHFMQGLALVECFGRIWICGWDVKKFPRLYDKFHIGDELTAVNDVQVCDIDFAHKLVKNVKAENIEISIRRLPHGQVFAIQRSAEGENLGIRRDGPTAEIIYVDPHGLASKHGLSNKATSMDKVTLCNWTLTEVNMRPLNLFSKDKQIEHRLLAVGKDISIVVQPSDLVREIKKQMKKLKNYKDFLLE
ncbi:uncharacterized protein LOC127841045 [Dreissena polymorpha]|uniref:PH domain-containing protein n=1 Tax=Dreissena polymorpha TaxID=45954 RepID=A0A9D4F268_DREPO|nr:uncharacterized protein LOC127841045 [Dreissena polymorpha]XP_052225518.1 uncharacterized protein LOC127841045 [Dreissena polymorpha]XP_052225519.1 uncharacterized protein LOC127841045 [Dreissena polymorpha]XP_052225520.1 uncharacterized protein LOC127841045 [Dreissena polymorpha]KAH3790021.1 hypothetical protein DPMN_168216 [Dreissena polymorpha]